MPLCKHFDALFIKKHTFQTKIGIVQFKIQLSDIRGKYMMQGGGMRIISGYLNYLHALFHTYCKNLLKPYCFTLTMQVSK